ncbi:hypothetical protein EIP86_008987 [Pleurotus ostreatoroseus]|nr:hypothetical protein EIP86_008987 [Pleurotus ostreatoroseus]
MSNTYDVVPIESAQTGLTPMLLPGRDLRCPPFFRYHGVHPLIETKNLDLVANVYIYFIDPSPEGKQRWICLQEQLKIPYCRDEELETVCPGLVEIEEGGWVFAREYDSDGKPENDILSGFVPPLTTAYSDADDELLAKLQAAVEPMLGTNEERAATGKIRFETFDRAKRVAPDTRAYLVGDTIEQPRQADAPAAASKTYDGELDEEQIIQKEFVAAVAEYGISKWEDNAPREMREPLEAYSCTINSPRTGCHKNYAWAAFQVNVAPAQDGASDGSLVCDLKGFGGEHCDFKDCAASLSSMTVTSKLPDGPGWQGGRFHLLALGIYVRLVRWRVVFFSGRLRHGGTSPLAPPGETATPGAFRMVVIGYPPETIVEGRVKHAFAALPHTSDPLWITQEMSGINSQTPGNITTATHANYAHDGRSMMDTQSHLNFMAYGSYQQIAHILRQTPACFGARLDPVLFLKAFKYELDTGEILEPDEWVYAPSGDIHGKHPELSENSAHDEARRQFTQVLWPKMAKAIPYAPASFSEPKNTGKPPPRPKSPSGKPPTKKVRYNQEQLQERDRLVAAYNNIQAGNQGLGWLTTLETLNSQHNNAQDDVTPSEDEDEIDLPHKKPVGTAADDTVEKDSQRQTAMEIDPSTTGCDAGGRISDHSPNRHSDALVTSARLSSAPLPTSQATPLFLSSLSDTEMASGREDIPNTRQASVDSDMSVHTPAPSDQRQLSMSPDSSTLTPTSSLYPKNDTTQDVDMADADSQDAQDLDYVYSDEGESEIPPSDEEEIYHGSDLASDLIEDEPDIPLAQRAACNTKKLSIATFVAKLNISVLEAEIDKVHGVHVALLDGKPNCPISEAFRCLDSLDYNAPPETLNGNAMQLLSSIWRSTGILYADAKTSEVWINSHRQRIMSADQYGTHLLTDIYAPKLRTMLETRLGDPNLEPIEELAKRIRGYLLCKKPITFRPSLYIDPAILPDQYKSGSYSERKVRPLSYYHDRRTPNYAACAADITVDIIREIFNQPSTYEAEARANFVKIVVRHFGAGALLLPVIWETWEDLPVWLVNHDAPKSRGGTCVSFHPSHHSQFEAAVQLSRPASRTSMEFRMIHELKLQYMALHMTVQDRVAALQKQISFGPRTKKHIRALDPSYNIRKSLAEGPTPAAITREQVRVIVSQFLRDTLHMIQHPELKTGSRLQKAIEANPDKNLPQRELAPSRYMFKTHPRPEDLDLRARLFSIFIWRGIFFNTSLLKRARDEPWLRVYFEDNDDFEEYIEEMKEMYPDHHTDGNFFCSRNAFTRQTLHGRGVETSEAYWNASKGWNSNMEESPMSFAAAHDRMTLLSSKIAGMGDLTCYLCVADLVEEGLVVCPTVNELGQLVKPLKAGGLKGLRVLQPLPVYQFEQSLYINAFLQNWNPAASSRTPLAPDLHRLLRIARETNVNFEALNLSPALKAALPVWHHISLRKTDYRNCNRSARCCLIHNHAALTVNDLRALVKYREDHPPPTIISAATVPVLLAAITASPHTACTPTNPSKWQPSVAPQTDNLSLTHRRKHANAAADRDEVLTFDPSVTEDGDLSACLRIFTEPGAAANACPTRHCFTARGPPVAVYIDGSWINNRQYEAPVGAGVFYVPGHPYNKSVRVASPGATSQTGEIAAIYCVALAQKHLPADLHIVSDSRTTIDGLTKSLKRWEDSGFIGVANKEWLQAAASWLRERGACTTLRWVKGHQCDPGNEGADARAKAGALLPATEQLRPQTNPRFCLTGAKVSILTQRLAYTALRDRINQNLDQRRATTINLDIARHAAEPLCGVQPTDKALWSAARHKGFSLRVRIFFWLKLLHGAHRVGEWWECIPTYEHRAVCRTCEVPETMEHILADCSAPGQREIWELCRRLWEQRGQPWPQLSFGTVLACGTASLSDPDNNPQPSTSRLYRILLSESAYLIWCLRCTRVIEHGDDPAKHYTAQHIEGRWRTIDARITLDCTRAHSRLG